MATAVVAAVLVVVNNYVRPKVERRVAVGRIFNSGGAVWFKDKSQDIGVENPYTAKTLNLWRMADSIDVKNDAQAIVVSQELARIPELGAIEFGRGVTDIGLSAVCNSRNVEAIVAISLWGCSITSYGISQLEQLPELRRIMFNTCPIDAAGLAQLKALRGVISLRFSEERPRAKLNRLDDACFSEIGQLTQLESLSFGAVNISDSAARKLHNLKNLKTLTFGQGYISDDAILELRSELPTTEIHRY